MSGDSQNGGLITNTSRISPFWRLITAIVTAPVMRIKDVLVTGVLANMFVATASGLMLRLLAWGVKLTAKPAAKASGTGAPQNASTISATGSSAAGSQTKYKPVVG